MRDELDDEITAALRGHMELSPELEDASRGASEAADGIELPKLPGVTVTPGNPTITSRNGKRELGPEQGPQLAGAFPKPDTFATPTARPGSIPAQLGASIAAAAPPKSTRAVNLAAPLGARDTELEGLQKSAKDRRAASGVGQAVTDFIERPTNLLDYAQRLGGGGVTAAPKSKMWQDAEGDRDISDLEQRRASEATMTKARTNAELAAEKKDPNSETAKTYRAVLSKFSPDVDLSNATPEQMERIAPWLEKFAAENADTLRAQAAAEAKAKADAEAKAAKAAEIERSQKNADRSYEASMANARATQGLASASLGVRKAEVEKKAADDVKDDVKDLAKALPGDLNDFTAKYNRIKQRLAANPDDIPGVGIWDSNKPKALRSSDDFDMQKDAGQMLAAYQKLITGAGASDAERATLAQISLDLENEKSFAAGLESLNEAYNAKVKQVRSGFASPVLNQYDANSKREGLGKPVKTMRLPSGEIVEVE